MDPDELPPAWAETELLVGDASTRRYARVRDRHGATAISVQYAADMVSQIERDLATRSWCEAHGLRVPALIDHSPGSDRVVVEDLGSIDAEQTLRATPPDERGALVRRLAEPVVTLARIPSSELPAWNKPLDAARLRWELAGFELWFLRHRCGVRPTARVGGWLDDLAIDIDRHPRKICHRDFHLNNLLLLDDGGVGVIDFQDILVGPDTYDMVSLLFERSMPELLGPTERDEIMDRWARETSADDGWRRRALQVRLQRALKVLGTFARLEASGVTSYVRWMRTLAGQLGAELEASDAPSGLAPLLLDC